MESKKMKTTPLNKIALAAMSLAMFAGSAGLVIAGDTSSKSDVAKVIQLHAPNNATQTVTIWTSKTIPRSVGASATARHGVPKVIRLPASNNSMQSVTVWTDSTAKGIDDAPLK
jgi:hypothetical protein